MKIRKLILCAVGLLMIAVNLNAASFDCGRAKSEVEKLVCGDPEFSSLDESLNKAYLRALRRADSKKKTIESQRWWLKEVRNACKNTECLKDVYETRIQELMTWDGDKLECGDEPGPHARGVTNYSVKKEIFSYQDGKMVGEDALIIWNRDAKQMCFSISTVSGNYHVCALSGKAIAMSQTEYRYSIKGCRASFTFLGNEVKVKMTGPKGDDFCRDLDGCGMRGSIDSQTYTKVRLRKSP